MKGLRVYYLYKLWDLVIIEKLKKLGNIKLNLYGFLSNTLMMTLYHYPKHVGLHCKNSEICFMNTKSCADWI
jgi:hypothetical protein